MNHFEQFSLPEKFDIDLGELEKKYLELQNQFHPDNAGLDDVEKSISINEAYKTLSDDFNRACYLLSLKNIDIQNDEKAIKPDFVTLEMILELQEKISEISDLKEIETLRTNLDSEVKILIEEAMKIFAENKIEQSAQILVKAKYLKKSLQDLKIRKRELNK